MESRVLTGVRESVLREEELVGFVRTPESGGVVCLSGIVRNHHEGRGVLRMEYSAATSLAESQLRRIAQESLEVPGVHRVAVLHRTGTLEVGEASVIVAASAAHREEAFQAARRLIDRVKEVVPVWKREHFDDGTTGWVPGFTIADGDRATAKEAREC
jgi:molybdopterin synthase catalytic subunit